MHITALNIGQSPRTQSFHSHRGGAVHGRHHLEDSVTLSSAAQAQLNVVTPKSVGTRSVTPNLPSGEAQPNDPVRRNRLLRGMLPRGVKPKEFDRWSEALATYDLDRLEKLQKSGVKMKLASKSDAAEYQRRREAAGLSKKRVPAGYYLADKKTVYLRPSTLKGPLAGEVTSHELGHAVDDLRDGHDHHMHSHTDKKFKKLYRGYMKRTEGLKRQGDGAMWTKYGRSSASEYYAEGAGLYYGGKSARETLREKDPELFKYLDRQQALGF